MSASPKTSQNIITSSGRNQSNMGTSSTNIELYSTILRACLYYDFFKFPLKINEIQRKLNDYIDTDSLEQALNALVELGYLKNIETYYGINITQDLIHGRIADEGRFDKFQKQLRRSVRIISKFPFVRGIAVSGSVSKGLVKPNGDIDFFILCKNDRLWLCRTLLVLNKKILRFNSRKYFCINYFIGDQSMEIPDRNIFVATELASLIPVFGDDIFDKFMLENAWYKDFIPHYVNHVALEKRKAKDSKIKLKTETILNGKRGQKLDDYFRRKTLNRWRKKFPHFTQEHFDLAMRSERNVSKHHPSNFQAKILEHINNGMAKYPLNK